MAQIVQIGISLLPNPVSKFHGAKFGRTGCGLIELLLTVAIQHSIICQEAGPTPQYCGDRKISFTANAERSESSQSIM